ncbi:UNVERIFIED_CONTAM: hypothetical protein Slati_1748400 [Sesamum latifolium]|uniref:Aminotransferase-like plant mobile domain-containing protein n=1 Tax=Sesamum latifolium TaxID=2727402 RepID=A0AAW2X1R7_9LAMI
MTSMMASGRQVNLAIPVLMSIYEGLNTIATSPRPSHTSLSFSIHLVYAWLAYYFKTHYPVWQGLRGPKMTRFSGEGGAKYYDPREARKQIHKAKFVSWACNMIIKNKPFKFIDNSNAEEFEHNYLLAICSSYLTVRQGNKFIIELYSPHRFGHQFGYYQDVPGTLTYDSHTASLEEGLRYWRLYVLSKSSSKAWFPYLPTNAKKFCSEAYIAWWAKIGTVATGIVTEKGSEELIPLKATKASGSRSSLADFVAELEDEVQSIDASEESQTSQKTIVGPNSLATTPPFVMGLKRKQPPRPTVVSVFEGESAYDEARSLSSEKLSKSLLEQQLKEAKDHLRDAQIKASEEASKVQSTMTKLEHIEKEIIDLKEQRTSLCATLKEQKQLSHDAQAKVYEIEEEYCST